MKPSRSLFLICALLAGCATADFTPYSGGQQTWPVAPGAFVDTKYDVPVYQGPPDRPYKVIGYLSADTAPVRRFAVVAFMARRAREVGGDGLILLSKGTTYGGSLQTTSVNAYRQGDWITGTAQTSSYPLWRGRGDGVVIKFL